MQVGSGGIWTDEETQDFKATGVNICKYILEHYPKTRVCVFTGTRYSVTNLTGLKLEFFLRKPVDPAELVQKVRHAFT